jgi:hypothetical protein
MSREARLPGDRLFLAAEFYAVTAWHPEGFVHRQISVSLPAQQDPAVSPKALPVYLRAPQIRAFGARRRASKCRDTAARKFRAAASRTSAPSSPDFSAAPDSREFPLRPGATNLSVAGVAARRSTGGPPESLARGSCRGSESLGNNYRTPLPEQAF